METTTTPFGSLVYSRQTTMNTKNSQSNLFMIEVKQNIFLGYLMLTARSQQVFQMDLYSSQKENIVFLTLVSKRICLKQ